MCRVLGSKASFTCNLICRTFAPRFFLTVAILATALLFASAADDQNTAELHSDKGLQLAQMGDLAGAESELRTAAALAPNNPEFLSNLATVLAIDKNLEESTKIFKRALKLDPTNLTARRFLAANLWQLHAYREARANLEIILKQKSDDAPSRLLLGMVAANIKDYATAARMLASVPKEVQKRPESIAALAISYYHLGEREKARSTLAELQERAVLLGAEIADQNEDYETAERFLLAIRENYADQADLGFRLATVQYHAHKFDQSEQTLLQLVSTGSTTAEIFNLLGWCYQQLGQDELAIHAFEQAISLLPHEESNYLDLEEVLAMQNNVVAALKVAKRATDACPRSPRAFISRGELEVRASQFTDAVTSYHEATVLDPHDADALLGSADSEYAADMKKEASYSFETGIRQHPKDARFPLHYASALLKQGEIGDRNSQLRAAALLKSAVSLDPSSADAHYQLGEIDLKEGRTTDALLEYRKAARLDPRNAKTHFGLSKVYRRLGRIEEASQETKLFEELNEAKPAASTALPGEPH